MSWGMKWDYKTVVLTGGFMGRHKEELRRDLLEQQFDQLGAEGRELALVLMGQALHKEKDGHVVIFKRPAPGGHRRSLLRASERRGPPSRAAERRRA